MPLQGNKCRREEQQTFAAGPLSLHDKHRTLCELHGAFPGGSIDKPGIFNVKLNEAMEFAS